MEYLVGFLLPCVMGCSRVVDVSSEYVLVESTNACGSGVMRWYMGACGNAPLVQCANASARHNSMGIASGNTVGDSFFSHTSANMGGNPF